MFRKIPSRQEQQETIRELQDSPEKLCRVISGSDLGLEDLSDTILAEGRKGVVKHSELRDYLTHDQLKRRRDREAYPKQGFPEKHFYQGIYSRPYNETSRGTTSSKMSPDMTDEIDN